MNGSSTKDNKYKEYSVFGKTYKVPNWVTERLIPILLLILVLGIVFTVFYIYNYHPEKVDTIKGWGYFGVFVISLIMNATLILPVGNIIVMAAMTTILPPVSLLGLSIPTFLCIGIIGGIAAAIGESTGYLAGYGGQKLVDEKKRNIYNKLEKWLNRYGIWFIIAMSIVPLAFDIMGLVAGVLKYPYKKFLIATAIGRIIMYSFVCLAFSMGWSAILSIFD